MKSRSLILRCLAAFLVLVFSQKTGAGLLYHDLFHVNATDEVPAGSEKDTNYACTCIDDHFMPFEGTEQTQLFIPLIVSVIIPEIFEDRLPFYTPVYSSLRGPPAIING